MTLKDFLKYYTITTDVTLLPMDCPYAMNYTAVAEMLDRIVLGFESECDSYDGHIIVTEITLSAEVEEF